MTRALEAAFIAALLIGVPAVASAEPKTTTPGAQMQSEGMPPGKSGEQKTEPGASEYAPGQANDNSAPGNSEYAPGQGNDMSSPGNSENAPGPKKK